MQPSSFGVLAISVALLGGCTDTSASHVHVDAHTVPSSRTQFRWDGASKTLTVSTSTLEVAIRGGAVVRLVDRRTGEVFSGKVAWQTIESSDTGFVTTAPKPERVGRTSGRQSVVRHEPSPPSRVDFSRVSEREVRLVYAGLRHSPPGDELTIEVRAEDGGELSFRAQARVAKGSPPTEVGLPFVALTSEAVIAGSGERFSRKDDAGKAHCVEPAKHMYSPAVAVIQGSKGVVGMWPEGKAYAYDDMVVVHTRSSDEVVPQVNLAINLGAQAIDPATATEPGVSRTSWWRLAALPSWLDVAKRYRADFERQTGVKPLWEQQPAWIRKIHAVMTDRPNTNDPAKADAFYARLAKEFDPQKLLLFYWNGSSLVLKGDNTYLTKLHRPTPEEVAALRKYGFRWIGYHPYNLVTSPPGIKRSLARERKLGFGVPKGYVFKSDYPGPGTVTGFFDYWRPVAAGYYHPLESSKTKLWILHPGAKKTREYLAKDFGDYCRQYGMSGAYLDTLGADNSGQYFANAPSDRRMVEGLDDRRGEDLALQAMRKANPGLAMASEYGSAWTIPYVFYTWEGESHFANSARPPNHPMRAACWGSYSWTRTDSPEALALLAGLPLVRPRDAWSVARAKLYVDEDLFNALPDHWDPAALAYYRGRNGNWFEYRRMPWGYAYVEVLGNHLRVLLGRFVGQSTSPLAEPVSIQNWPAYKDGKPIGLDPTQAYDFIMAPAPAADRLRITDLPRGAYISGFHEVRGYSVVEFGTGRQLSRGKVKVTFGRRCLGVLDAQGELGGPFPAGASTELTTRVPGALLFLWAKIPRLRKKAEFLERPNAEGHTRANGTPYSYWTRNGKIGWEAEKALSGKARVFALGIGKHRAYADQWVNLPSGVATELRFETTLAEPAGMNEARITAALSVRVNGTVIWRKVLAPGKEWSSNRVSLAAYAGRSVLLTLSAEAVQASDLEPKPRQPVRVRNLQFAPASPAR